MRQQPDYEYYYNGRKHFKSGCLKLSTMLRHFEKLKPSKLCQMEGLSELSSENAGNNLRGEECNSVASGIGSEQRGRSGDSQ